MPFPPEFATTDATPEVAEDAIAPDDLVTISRWELDALRAKIAGGAAMAAMIPESTNPAPAVEDSREKKMIEMERGYKAAIRDRELATALAGRPLLPGAAAQLIKLWREDFDVFEEGGELRVASRDGRPVAKAVAERLAEADYAHFLPPSSRGGASGKGAIRPARAENSPRNLGEAVLQQWRESAPARLDPTAGPIGLKRR